jgi:hypothetical protein
MKTSEFQRLTQMLDTAPAAVRSELAEYLECHERFVELTGSDEPSEAMLLDVLLIEDIEMRREAAVLAGRMRSLARAVFPLLLNIDGHMGANSESI